MKNKECEVPFCRKLAKRGKMCSAHKKAAWRKANPEHAAFLNLKQSAKRRNIAFELTLEQFREFCAATSFMKVKAKAKNFFSVDRIDSDKGYSICNIQVLTVSENSKKEHERRKAEKILIEKHLHKTGYFKDKRTPSEPDNDCRPSS
jgi:hypothetical protein